MRAYMLCPPILQAVSGQRSWDDVCADGYDALVAVAPAPRFREPALLGERFAPLLEAVVGADASLARGKALPVVLPAKEAPGGRLVLVPMAALQDDTDDVRSVLEAVAAGIGRAVDAGASKPLLWLDVPGHAKFAYARDVAALSALASQWSPLEAREAGKAARAAELLGVMHLPPERCAYLQAVELGRALCRDIGGTEPERMTPLRIVELCEQAFGSSGIALSVERDLSERWPLLAAVARASMSVPRHHPCVLKLEYTPPGEVKSTVVLAGKGVTYDTGGADLKTDGAMAGMSRDKGGAAAVAGLMRTLSVLKPQGLRVIGLLGLVRNSIGEESFVSDEIIKSRAGVRVRIGNTDAEGRLVLADLLAYANELTKGAQNASIFSIATLTGHVYRAYGPYIGAIGNGPARISGLLDKLDTLGELWGEPMERSRPRREDYAFVAARSSAEDVLSSNRLASVSTPRGHQFPFAFLDIASGLRRSATPFVHLDIGGAALDPPDWQFGRPTGVPIATLADYLTHLF